MKENQPTLFKKKIFVESTGQIKKPNSDNPPLPRRVLNLKNEIVKDTYKPLQLQQKNDNQYNRQDCAKQAEIQQKLSKISTRKIFDQMQLRQFENTMRNQDNGSTLKKHLIFGPQSDRVPGTGALQSLSKKLLGIAQTHTTQQSYQNQGDIQCNYEEEDSMEEYNLLLKKKQPPSAEISTQHKISLQINMLEQVFTEDKAKTILLYFESKIILIGSSINIQDVYQQKQQGLNQKQQYFLWDQFINFNSVQKKYELQYYNYTLLPSPSDTEILKDLDRTIITKGETIDGKQKDKLKKILRAISHNSKEVGYVQGLNQIVGTLLPSNLKENDIYWIVLYFLKKLKLNEMYKEGFPRLKILTFQLEIFMQNYLPELLQYLKDNNISVSYFCTKWFITLFSYDLDNQMILKVWNLFLIKGWKVLIRIALGLLKLFEKEIMNEPVDNLSDYIRNFAENNQRIVMERNLIETGFSMKVTNRLLKSLQNIYEQHQQYNCKVYNLNILLFQNHKMNNVYDWKILPQAPHFEGQNSTLERLNAQTMVADYINELSSIQAQRKATKTQKQSFISFEQQQQQEQMKGISLLNKIPQKKQHQRSLSSTRSSNILLNQFDFPIQNLNDGRTTNSRLVNRREENNYYDARRKSITLNGGEDEEPGFLQQIQNKIISIFNNEGQEQERQQSRPRQNEREIQPIQLLINKPPYIRQSSTPQIFQKNPTQTKYYDQILEDYKEINDQNRGDDEESMKVKIKKIEQAQQITQAMNTAITDVNEFENTYSKPQQNFSKYMIVQKPSNFEKIQLNQPPVPSPIRSFQPSQIQMIPTMHIQQMQQPNFNRTIRNVSPNQITLIQPSKSPDFRSYHTQQYQQQIIIPQQHVQRVIPVSNQGWTIVNQRY